MQLSFVKTPIKGRYAARFTANGPFQIKLKAKNVSLYRVEFSSVPGWDDFEALHTLPLKNVAEFSIDMGYGSVDQYWPMEIQVIVDGEVERAEFNQ